jgi:hypothetical protein
MLENLTLESMRPHLQSTFRVTGREETQAVLTLVEVRDLTTPATAPRSADQRTPFSLLFLAPAEFRIPQGMVSLRHDLLGSMEIFVVPVATDENGMYYEAVFN